MSSAVKIGLLGHGTVGGAFAGLLAERADAIAALTGRRPEISGVLTRSQGDREAIVDGADIVVEVMGGLDPSRALVLRALRGGRHVVTANKQLVSRHGDELHGIESRKGEHRDPFRGTLAPDGKSLRHEQQGIGDHARSKQPGDDVFHVGLRISRGVKGSSMPNIFGPNTASDSGRRMISAAP